MSNSSFYLTVFSPCFLTYFGLIPDTLQCIGPGTACQQQFAKDQPELRKKG